ncbi:hypothetical protein BN1708_017191, partial [Verticillium longisporum]
MSFFFWALASWLTFRGLFGGFNNNEYAQILAKRVAEKKAEKADARKRRASSMRK